MVPPAAVLGTSARRLPTATLRCVCIRIVSLTWWYRRGFMFGTYSLDRGRYC